MTIKNRVKKLETAREAKTEITEIFVVGGALGADGDFMDATIAGKVLNREEGETIAAFRSRSCAAARTVGVTHVAYGLVGD
jgi:ribosomal protein L21